MLEYSAVVGQSRHMFDMIEEDSVVGGGLSGCVQIRFLVKIDVDDEGRMLKARDSARSQFGCAGFWNAATDLSGIDCGKKRWNDGPAQFGIS